MGIPSLDFPRIASFIRGQALPEALHVHFKGAGGNIGAGKYNDGAKPNHMVVAIRLADGMRRARDATKKHLLSVDVLGWQTVPVNLSVADHLNEAKLIESIKAESSSELNAPGAARKLAWLQPSQVGHPIDIGCLRVGKVRVLHMPGELFVEYQLTAKAMRPDLHIAMAAYGDIEPGYMAPPWRTAKVATKPVPAPVLSHRKSNRCLPMPSSGCRKLVKQPSECSRRNQKLTSIKLSGGQTSISSGKEKVS